MSDGAQEQRRTITFVNEDELQVHKLYRERIVQEDNLIDNRMIWMIASQAFLFALWAGVLQSVLQRYPVLLAFGTIPIPIIGILFGAGSLFSIKAAQDQIVVLRANYLLLFPRKKTSETTADVVRRPWVRNLPARINEFIAYLLTLDPLWEHKEKDASEIRLQLLTDPLPGLTGLKNFHAMGHIMPKYMGHAIILIWLFFLLLTGLTIRRLFTVGHLVWC
jgi:hypothetical protein